MKTINKISILILIFVVTNTYGQYLETFPIPNKGILIGGCSGTEASCFSDFTGVDWTINGDFTGMDIDDFLSTTGAGVLEFFGDIDGELCYESPLLDISDVAGSVTIFVDVVWTSHDGSDYADLEYKIDGGPWVQSPNQFGGGTHTIDFGTPGNSGSGTVSQGGISGSTLSVRFCVLTGTSGDNTTIDNVSIPETGTKLFVLPVQWGDVSVDSKGSKNILEWTTHAEVNNDRFEIEHKSSLSGQWQSIGTAQSLGDTQKKSVYSFIDKKVTSRNSYYRVKQIDLDGDFDYSEVVFSRNNMLSDFDVYPNPVENDLLIRSSNIVEDHQVIKVFDATGRFILVNRSMEDDYLMKLNTSELDPGIYFIQVSSGDMRKIIKL